MFTRLLTALTFTFVLNVGSALAYSDPTPTPRPEPSCIKRGDCIVSPFLKNDNKEPDMEGREGVPPSAGSGSRVKDVPDSEEGHRGSGR